MSEPAIQTRGLTRRFGDLLAVDRLDLTVAPGEVLGFLGPNGAGKTTTVRMLAGLIGPTGGKARVNGFDVADDPESVRRSVGILTETPGLYARLSARRNLEIFAGLYDVPDPAARVERYLKLLDLWDRRDDPAGSFSKGMRQRLAIGRALLHEPPILFLDEPTSALDPKAARRVRDVILSLKEQGRTIFLCTHNLEEADQLCDRVAIFKTRLLVLDTADRLRDAIYGRQVAFRLQRATADHLAAVEALDFPLEAALDEENGQILVRTDDPQARNPAIVKSLVDAGAALIFVSEIEHSLEKVYLELVNEGEGGSGDA